ncbi:hypothetical protein OM416_20365 [Paenibacillus sp. LS1]|nr:hypothetical protein [Paenibacillus sp. LS1]
MVERESAHTDRKNRWVESKMQKRSNVFPNLTGKNAKVLAQDTIALAKELGYKIKKKNGKTTDRPHR